MKGISKDLNLWLTDADELQGYNPYFRSPTSRMALAYIQEVTKTNGFIEPLYGGTDTIIFVSSSLYENLSPWSTKCIPCDGIIVEKESLKRDHMALLARSRDNLMLMLQDDIRIILLSIGVDTLNQGILKKLPTLKGNVHVAMSSCIGPEHLYYDFDHCTRISNFKPLGYSPFVKLDKGNFHIDLRSIVRYELKHNVQNVILDFEDNRDTYLCPKLYSMRKGTNPASANCMVVW